MRSLLVALLLLCSHAMPAQNIPRGSWSWVESQDDGTHLIVTANRHATHCTLTGITDDGLECAIHGRLVWFDRDAVDQVSLPAGGHGVLIATSIGAAAGAILAGVSSDGTGTNAAASALAGGFGLGFITFLYAQLFTSSHPHGTQILYQR